jgi:hypothetical protein
LWIAVYFPTTAVPTPAATTSSSVPSTMVPITLFPVDMFKRGIKRDPSVFPTLKDELLNDQWHRTFANQARAQDVSDVLDPSYKPSTPAENDLFKEKPKYLYAVLVSKVEMAKGKQSFVNMRVTLMLTKYIRN